MLDTIKGLFSKIAEIFKKEKVAITERVEPTIQKEPPKEEKKQNKEPQIKEIDEIKKEKVVKKTTKKAIKEESSEIVNETKAHSRENREKKFEHSPIVDKDIWE